MLAASAADGAVEPAPPTSVESADAEPATASLSDAAVFAEPEPATVSVPNFALADAEPATVSVSDAAGLAALVLADAGAATASDAAGFARADAERATVSVSETAGLAAPVPSTLLVLVDAISTGGSAAVLAAGRGSDPAVRGLLGEAAGSAAGVGLDRSSTRRRTMSVTTLGPAVARTGGRSATRSTPARSA